MSLKVITFGCRLNIYESQIIEKNAREAGMNNTLIFNSCAVTKEAERKLRMYLSEDPALCKVNSENMCVLGLRTEQEKLEKNKAVKESIRTVLLAQLEQERKFLKQADDESIFSLDLDDIAKQYAIKTQEAAEDALERGLRKAKHLQHCLLKCAFWKTIEHLAIKVVISVSNSAIKMVSFDLGGQMRSRHLK